MKNQTKQLEIEVQNFVKQQDFHLLACQPACQPVHS